MKIPDAKAASGQGMGEAGKIASVALEQGEEQKGGYSGSTMREKESPRCYIDGHLSSQKCGAGTKGPKVQRASRAPK